MIFTRIKILTVLIIDVITIYDVPVEMLFAGEHNFMLTEFQFSSLFTACSAVNKMHTTDYNFVIIDTHEIL